MASESEALGEVYSQNEASVAQELAPSYGLRSGILSPLETLAQSVSTMAPTTSPTMTIPLVFALAGNGTWLVYLLATVATLLVGYCVSRFARLTASPGSLYMYVATTLRPELASLCALALLIAYLATGMSVAGGALYFTNLLLHSAFGFTLSPFLVVLLIVALACFVACRDVKLSAQLMLWIEILSISMIAIVIALLFYQQGFHLDPAQLALKGLSVKGAGLGLVLALFSFVGFESATTLGTEARDPLRTIPRVVLQCAIIAGVFFLLCSYAEVLGFHGEGTALQDSSSPLRVLATKAGVEPLGVAIDIGALVSMFACVLACITAAARVLMRMAHAGLAPRWMTATSKKHSTPVAAICVSSMVTLIPAGVLAARGISGFDIYGWTGSLATYGFLTAYALVAAALPLALRKHQQSSLRATSAAVLTILVMLLAIGGSVYSGQDAPYNLLPWIYIAYLVLGMVLIVWKGVKAPVSN